MALKRFYFWRDSKGKEVDLLADKGDTLAPVEINRQPRITKAHDGAGVLLFPSKRAGRW
jgi:predicted AAA+ superfamily ATPase